MRLASTKINFQLSLTLQDKTLILRFIFLHYINQHAYLYLPSRFASVIFARISSIRFSDNWILLSNRTFLIWSLKKMFARILLTHAECTILFCFHKRKQNITKLFLCSQICIRYTCVQTQFQSSVNNIRYIRYLIVWPKKNFIFSRGVKTFKPIWTFLLQNIVD